MPYCHDKTDNILHCNLDINAVNNNYILNTQYWFCNTDMTHLVYEGTHSYVQRCIKHLMLLSSMNKDETNINCNV